MPAHFHPATQDQFVRLISANTLDHGMSAPRCQPALLQMPHESLQYRTCRPTVRTKHASQWIDRAKLREIFQRNDRCGCRRPGADAGRTEEPPGVTTRGPRAGRRGSGRRQKDGGGLRGPDPLRERIRSVDIVGCGGVSKGAHHALARATVEQHPRRGVGGGVRTQEVRDGSAG